MQVTHQNTYFKYTFSPPRKKCEHEGCTNVAVRGGRCKSHGAASKRCEIQDCQKVAVISGVCRRHARTKTEEAVAFQQKPKHEPARKDPPFSPIVSLKPSTDDSNDPTEYQGNDSVIAQNNHVIQSKLSQVIEAHGRLGERSNHVSYPYPYHHPYALTGQQAYSHGYSHPFEPPYPYSTRSSYGPDHQGQQKYYQG